MSELKSIKPDDWANFKSNTTRQFLTQKCENIFFFYVLGVDYGKASCQGFKWGVQN